jgi:hypothetical protein
MRPPKRNKRKSPPRKRNLAAKVLRDPLFRPKVMANPNAYRRRKRFIVRPEDESNNN